MANMSEEILVRVPLQEVWDFFIDYHNLPAWCANVFAIEEIGAGPVALGASWQETWRWAGRLFELTTTIAELEPRQLIVMNYTSPHHGSGEMRITCQPEGGGTCTRIAITVGYTVPLGVFSNIADRLLFDKLTGQQVSTNVEALRQVLESRHAAHRYHSTAKTNG